LLDGWFSTLPPSADTLDGVTTAAEAAAPFRNVRRFTSNVMSQPVSIVCARVDVCVRGQSRAGFYPEENRSDPAAKMQLVLGEPFQESIRLVAATLPYHRPESFTVRFLTAEVHILEAITLALAVGHSKLSRRLPGMREANFGSVCNGARGRPVQRCAEASIAEYSSQTFD
jgi:hypothetical protein